MTLRRRSNVAIAMDGERSAERSTMVSSANQPRCAHALESRELAAPRSGAHVPGLRCARASAGREMRAPTRVTTDCRLVPAFSIRKMSTRSARSCWKSG